MAKVSFKVKFTWDRRKCNFANYDIFMTIIRQWQKFEWWIIWD